MHKLSLHNNNNNNKTKKKKKEKQRQIAERERLRREIAKDKAERKARGGMLAGKLSVEGYAPAAGGDDR